MQLTIKNLTKKYGSNKIGLSDYSIDISSGILGLLGPNGAGKSTLIKMISTISKPTSGSIQLDGEDILKNPNSMRKILGYLPQDFGIYPNLNAYEFLAYMAAMKGIGGQGLKKRIDSLLEGLNLMEVAKNQLGTYSGGMIQRVGIAQTMLNDPKVIIFDEPTVGLDPEERLRFRDLISDLSSDRIVILSSHIVSDIESIADEVVVMKSGSLITNGPQNKIIQTAEGKVFLSTIEKTDIVDFKAINTIISSQRIKEQFKVRYISDTPHSHADSVVPTLEDAYILLTKH